MLEKKTIEEKTIPKIINRKVVLEQELKELEKKQKEIEKLKKLKSQELYQIEKEYPNLIIEQGKEKKTFYCGICQGSCEGLRKGYFH